MLVAVNDDVAKLVFHAAQNDVLRSLERTFSRVRKVTIKLWENAISISIIR